MSPRPNPQADSGVPRLCDDPPLDGCPKHDAADSGSEPAGVWVELGRWVCGDVDAWPLVGGAAE